MAENWLDRAHALGTPLIEGDTAIFVWQGDEPPDLIGDFNLWNTDEPASLTMAEPGVWIYRLDLPADAYMEYVYIKDGERFMDPFNPRSEPNGMGQFNNVFYMPEGKQAPETCHVVNIPHGQVTFHRLKTEGMLAGDWRSVYLYQPPVSGPCPLVLVWDGYEYLNRVGLPDIVDNLIAQRRIRPVALAMVENSPYRSIEYACAETTLGFLHYQLLPFARQQLDLIDTKAEPGAYGVLGASMGGLMALYLGLRSPGIFGRVLSQSGAFGIDEQEFVVYDLARCASKLDLKIWMDVGRYEGLLETNRKMHRLLEEKGCPVTYREYNGGHNYPSWCNDLSHGLEQLFPASPQAGAA